MVRKLRLFIFVVLFVVMLTTTIRVYAAGYVVSDCGDNGDTNQLRAKLTAAQSTGGTITFTCGPATILLNSTLLVRSQDVTIDGGGKITLSGGNTVQLVSAEKHPFADMMSLTLKNITLTRGYNAGGNGGAIEHSSGTLHLLHTQILDNHVPDEFKGGGIASSGDLTITDSTLAGNSAWMGGAIYVEGQLDLSNVTLRNNTATYEGAGIYNLAGDVTLTNVTANENSAAFDGGGIYNENGSVALTNVTFSENSATTYDGGGFYNYDGSATLTNVTLVGNSAPAGGGIFNNYGVLTLVNGTLSGNRATNEGGGIFNGTGTVTLKNTILAKGAQGANCKGFSGGSSNLADDNSCGFGSGRDNVTDLLLGPLASNGGFTKTILPQSGSRAIDNGTSSGAPNTDQRGVTRPQGTAVDVGAVEVSACAVKPAKPILTKPGNNKKAKGPNVFLDWNDANCATHYDILVKQGSTSGPKAFKQKNQTNSSAMTKALTKGLTYYRRVSAKNAIGKTKSDWFKFKVK